MNDSNDDEKEDDYEKKYRNSDKCYNFCCIIITFISARSLDLTETEVENVFIKCNIELTASRSQEKAKSSKHRIYSVKRTE